MAKGRWNRFFAGSERGGRLVAIAYTPIETAQLNDADPSQVPLWHCLQLA